MDISIFGLGYVGAVSCGCLAQLGHNIIGVDIAQHKVDAINRSESPIVEHDLQPLLQKAVNNGKLSATTDACRAVLDTELAFICVGTPPTASGGVDISQLERVCSQIGEALKESSKGFFTVFNRSTSLPVVQSNLMTILQEFSGRQIGKDIGFICHPEFLREGAAVNDFFHPPKIVFGASDKKSEKICQELYPTLSAEKYFVDVDTAAVIKYADNSFHALKVTFANEIGSLCKELSLDSHAVMDIFCKDRELNISPRYLRPGFAFGGSCLPKDLRAVIDTAREKAITLPMLSGVMESNRIQIENLLNKIPIEQRPRVGIIGLAFKEGTDDVRDSPMIALAERLGGKGLDLKIYDQHLSIQKLVGTNKSFALNSIPHLSELISDDLQAVVDHSEILIVCHRLTTEIWSKVHWPTEQRLIDLVNIPELKEVTNYEGLYW